MTNEQFSRITLRNGEVFLVFGDNKLVQPTLDLILDVLTPPQFKQIFRIAYADKKFFVDDKFGLLKFEFDPDDPRIVEKMGYDEKNMEKIRGYRDRSIESLVPEELKDQYCLLDGDKVIFSSHSYEQIKIFKLLTGKGLVEYLPANRS